MTQSLPNSLEQLKQAHDSVQHYANEVLSQAEQLSSIVAQSQNSFFMTGITVFVLAVFIGYFVVWNVTPALHSPLMAVTNAISSVVIVGALIATGPSGFSLSTILGFFAVILASVNIFGGFLVTQRMLSMFKKKKEKEA